MKTIYNVHPITREYLSPSEADESPLEPGVYLIPAHATELAPPTLSGGQVALLDGEVWTVVADVRGTWYGADGQAVQIDALDADVHGYTRMAPPSHHHDLVAGSWVLNAERALAQTKVALIAFVQAHMEAAAQALGYDSLLSAVSYADEPSVPTFQAQGQAFRAWRSAVWAQCYVLLAEVQAETRAVPTAEELLALLPALELP